MIKQLWCWLKTGHKDIVKFNQTIMGGYNSLAVIDLKICKNCNKLIYLYFQGLQKND
jgi:hypothetical protein